MPEIPLADIPDISPEANKNLKKLARPRERSLHPTPDGEINPYILPSEMTDANEPSPAELMEIEKQKRVKQPSVTPEEAEVLDPSEDPNKAVEELDDRKPTDGVDQTFFEELEPNTFNQEYNQNINFGRAPASSGLTKEEEDFLNEGTEEDLGVKEEELRDEQIKSVQDKLIAKPQEVEGEPSEIAEAGVQAIGGILDVGQEGYNFAVDVIGTTAKMVGGIQNLNIDDYKTDFADRLIPPSKDTSDKFIRGAVGFLIPFSGMLKGIKALNIMGKTGRVGQYAQITAAGVAAEFAFTDPKEEGIILPFLRDNISFSKPYLDIVTAKSDDDPIVKRAKKSLDGMVGGILGDALFKSFSLIRKFRQARKSITKFEKNEKVTKEDGLPPVIDEQPLPPKIEEEAALPDIPKEPPKVEGISGMKPIDSVNAARENFDKIVSKRIDQAINKAGKTREQLQKEADELGMTVEQFLERDPNAPINDIYTQAANDIAEDNMLNMVNTAKKFDKKKTGTDTFLKEVDLSTDVARQFEDVGTTGGRTLRTRKETAERFQTIGTLSPRELLELKRIYGDNPEVLAKAIIRADKKALRKALGAKDGQFLENLRYYQMNHLLSSPMTHAKNIYSSAGNMFGKIGQTSLQAAFNRIRKDPDAIRPGELAALLKGFWAGFRDNLGVVHHNLNEMRKLKVGRGEKLDLKSFFDDSFTKFDDTEGRVAKEIQSFNELNALGKAGRVMKGIITGEPVGRLLVGEDNFFKYMNYRGAIHQEAIRMVQSQGLEGRAARELYQELITNTSPELHKIGLKSAREMTFTNETSGFFRKIDGMAKHNEVFRWLFPFTRTNLNILATAIDYSPGISMLAKKNRTVWNQGGRAGQEMWAKQTFGAMVSGLMAYSLLDLDAITPGDSLNYRNQHLLKTKGQQKYSFKFEDGSFVSYENLGPISEVMKFTADLTELASYSFKDEIDSSEFWAAGSMVMMNYLTPEFLADFTYRVTDLAERGNSASMRQFLASAPLRYAPYSGLARNLNKGIDNRARDSKAMKTMFDQILAEAKKIYLPKGSQLLGVEGLPVKRNIFGEALPHHAYENWWDIANPFMTTQDQRDPLIDELVRLTKADKLKIGANASHFSPLSVEMPARKGIKRIPGVSGIKGRTYTLDPYNYERLVGFVSGESEELSKALGGNKPPALRKIVGEFMKSGEYKRMPDMLRVAVLRKMFGAYKRAGTKLFLGEMNTTEWRDEIDGLIDTVKRDLESVR